MRFPGPTESSRLNQADVESPTQAIEDFYGIGLDALAIEDFVLEK